MAQKVSIELVDDIDGSSADETVTFGLDGKKYEIDLSAANAGKLREALAPFVAHGRRPSRGRRGASRSGVAPAEIRGWARSNGMKVPDRGRVSEELRTAYDAAH